MSYRTIKLKRYNDIVNEFPAGGAILPGDIVAVQSDGTVDVNPTAGANIPVHIALENELEGKTTRDAYAADDQVFCWYVTPGEEAMVNIITSDDPAVGATLETATAGKFRIETTGQPIFEVTGPKEIDEDNNHRVPVRRI